MSFGRLLPQYYSEVYFPKHRIPVESCACLIPALLSRHSIRVESFACFVLAILSKGQYSICIYCFVGPGNACGSAVFELNLVFLWTRQYSPQHSIRVECCASLVSSSFYSSVSYGSCGSCSVRLVRSVVCSFGSLDSLLPFPLCVSEEGCASFLSLSFSLTRSSHAQKLDDIALLEYGLLYSWIFVILLHALSYLVFLCGR